MLKSIFVVIMFVSVCLSQESTSILFPISQKLVMKYDSIGLILDMRESKDASQVEIYRSLHVLVHPSLQYKYDSLLIEKEKAKNQLDKSDILQKLIQIINDNKSIEMRDSIIQKYPFYALSLKNKKKIKAVGTSFILSGLSALTVTIVNANKEETMTMPIPYKPSNKITIKNQWTRLHTVSTILSSTAILFGMVLVFNY